jgi:hypothetical protein
MLKTEYGRGYRLLGPWTAGQELSPEPAGLELLTRPVEPFQTNLPAAVSELVGRTIAVQHLCGLLSACRAVTLTGPGGIFADKSDSSCTAGAVHTWPLAPDHVLMDRGRYRSRSGHVGASA